MSIPTEQEQIWTDIFQEAAAGGRKQPIDNKKFVRAINLFDKLKPSTFPVVIAHSVSEIPETERMQWESRPTCEPAIYAKVSNKPAERGRTKITARQVLMGKIKEGQVTVKFGTPSRFYRFGKRIHHDTAFGLYRKGVGFTVL